MSFAGQKDFQLALTQPLTPAFSSYGLARGRRAGQHRIKSLIGSSRALNPKEEYSREYLVQGMALHMLAGIPGWYSSDVIAILIAAKI